MKCKLFLAAACGLLFAGAASSANAGDITYDTSAPTVVLTDGVTVSYVSYGPNDISSDPASPFYAPSPVDVDYGTFTATGPSTSNADVSGQTYDITLNVFLPTPNGGVTIPGAISGHFYANGVNNNVDTLQFVPNPGTYTQTYNKDGIGTVTWTFDSTNIGVSGGLDQGEPPYTGDLLGTVTYTTVPLPASALGGAALIGLVGVARIRKNRQLI